jgi:hypothetical protein
MTQRPDGPADILDRLRVASRNGIAREVCEHAILEIERLRATLDQLLRDAQKNGFIGDNIDDAIGWAVRQMAAAHQLRREIKRRADLEPGGHVLDDDLRKAGVTP